MAIIVGNEAIDRDSFAPDSYTFILMQNPALLAGKITLVKCFVHGTLENFAVGIFQKVTGTTFTSRSHVVIGGVATGYQEKIVDLAIEVGDYIGYYTSNGTLDRTDSGDGYWYLIGDETECVETEFSVSEGKTVSLQGIGAEVGKAKSKAIVVG